MRLRNARVEHLHETQRPHLWVLQRLDDLFAFPSFVLNSRLVAPNALEKKCAIFFREALYMGANVQMQGAIFRRGGGGGGCGTDLRAHRAVGKPPENEKAPKHREASQPNEQN